MNCLKTGIVFAIASLCAFAFIAGQAQAQQYVGMKPPVLEPGKVLVKVERGVRFNINGTETGVPSIDRILAREFVNDIKPLERRPQLLNKSSLSPEAEILSRVLIIKYGSETDPELLAKELTDLPEVEIAEPNEICYPDYTPNDPQVSMQWAIAMMQLEQAWEITKGSEDVVIGIVDSGVQWDHPDLAANIYINKGEWGTNGELKSNGIDDDQNGYIDDWHGWDCGDDDNNPMDRPEDIMGMITYHGTGVAGCASAATDNGLGIASSGFNCKILPVKAAEDAGKGMSNGYEGIKYAADMNCKVINNSWGGGKYSQIAQDIVNYATSRGCLVVGSAGNEPLNNDFTPHYPSAFDGVLSVSSQEPGGEPSDWSVFGASVDVFAPGSVIRTTLYGGGYEFTQGTSFSAPIASGVAGLLWSIHPTWTPAQIRKQLKLSSSKFAATRDPQYFGYMNAYRALTTNLTFADFPGLTIKRFSYKTENSPFNRFRKPGEKAVVTVTFQNTLAPTSANAAVQLYFDDADQLTANPNQFTLGALNTNDTIQVTFEVTLTNNVKVAEGQMPIRFVFTDGEYIDYEVRRFDILIDDAWRTKYTPENLPGETRFVAIHVISENYIWSVAKSDRSNYCRRSINGGTTWTDSDGSGYPSTREVKCIFGIDAGKAVIGTGGTASAVAYRTTNSGANWSGAVLSTITGDVNGIHMYDASNGILAGSPKNKKWGIAKTIDGGTTWTAITTPVTADSGATGWANSFDAYANTIWFGTNQSRIFRSTDKGNTWSSFPTPEVHSFSLSFRDELTGAARFIQYTDKDTVTTGNHGIGITSDGGQTWSMLATIQLDAPGYVGFERRGKRLWAVNWNDVYISSDLGQTWKVEAVPRGFDSTQSMDIFTNTTSNGRTVVYAGGKNLTTYSSAWQENTGTSAEPVGSPDAFSLNTLYPNPAGNGSAPATIEFTLPASGRTEIAVYDMNGRLVMKSLDAVLAPGTHSASIRTQTLHSGTYIVRLSQSGLFRTTLLNVVR